MQKLSEIKTSDGKKSILPELRESNEDMVGFNAMLKPILSCCVDTEIDRNKLAKILAEKDYHLGMDFEYFKLADALLLSKDTWVKIIYVKKGK